MTYNSWQRLGLVFSIEKSSKNRNLIFSHTQCPFYVNIEDREERIYFASRDNQNISRIFYIRIKSLEQTINLVDNEIHGPIIDIGESKDFDSHGVMPSWIIKINDDYFMYYVGWRVEGTLPYQNSIGLGISENGLNSFKKYKKNPIISKNKYDTSFTGTSCVIKFKNIFFNYYMSCIEWIINPKTQKKEPLYFLKIATSIDGFKWKISNKTVIPLQKEWGGIVKASVINIRDKLHMWFSYRGRFDYRFNKEEAYKIGYATSEDGYDWSLKNFSFDKTEGSEADYLMQAYPHVYQKENNLFMLYNGNEFGKSGIFLAKCNIALSQK